jgi:prophage maintenance system killer protein
MDVNKAIKILQGNPQAINKMHSQILRDLEKSGTINDKQKIESENINTNLNIPLKTTDEVLDENADTITRFIERRMHTTDSTTD